MKSFLSGTILLTGVLFVWGAVVRTTGAGMACPDWPRCHGQWIPPFDFFVLLEWGHRLIASLVGIATLAITIIALVRSSLRARIGGIALAAFCLLIAQAFLGAAAVFGDLQPEIVSVHLATGFLFLTLLLWMRERIRITTGHGPRRESLEHPALHFFLVITIVLVYAQIVLGSYVAASGAGLACPDFPLCRGMLIPTLTPGVAPQLLHRLGALLTILLLALVLIGAAFTPLTTRVKRLLSAAGLVTAVQIFLGIGTVLWELPIVMRVAHLGVAVLLYVLLFLSAYEVRRGCVSQPD